MGRPGRSHWKPGENMSKLDRLKRAVPAKHRRCLACGDRPAAPARLGYCDDCWGRPG